MGVFVLGAPWVCIECEVDMRCASEPEVYFALDTPEVVLLHVVLRAVWADGLAASCMGGWACCDLYGRMGLLRAVWADGRTTDVGVSY